MVHEILTDVWARAPGETLEAYRRRRREMQKALAQMARPWQYFRPSPGLRLTPIAAGIRRAIEEGTLK